MKMAEIVVDCAEIEVEKATNKNENTEIVAEDIRIRHLKG
jgi:hypothetical protein